jgi:hypothetical protein
MSRQRQAIMREMALKLKDTNTNSLDTTSSNDDLLVIEEVKNATILMSVNLEEVSTVIENVQEQVVDQLPKKKSSFGKKKKNQINE